MAVESSRRRSVRCCLNKLHLLQSVTQLLKRRERGPCRKCRSILLGAHACDWFFKGKMPKISNKSATKLDKLVGQNIRIHRLACGLTQEQLGAKLDVTFQQVQKYEKGINRIGSGRLYQIADILEVPVKSFFKGETKQPAYRHWSPFDLLADAMTMQMAREFAKIGDIKIRRAVLAVIEALTSSR